MDGLIFEPLTLIQTWHRIRNNQAWVPVLSDYLSILGNLCGERFPASLVGHIKAMAGFSCSEYIRFSLVSPGFPVGVDGHVPKDCTSLTLTVNVLVYGISRIYLESMNANALLLVLDRCDLAFSVTPVKRLKALNDRIYNHNNPISLKEKPDE